MKSATPLLLTLNGGSSSIKFALYEAGEPPLRLWSGAVERIGLPGATFRVQGRAAVDNFTRDVSARDADEAAGVLVDWLKERAGPEGPEAIGHRIVHGGGRYWAPERITDAMLGELRRLSPFDPEHLPGEIQLAATFQRRFPQAIQVACFDTAFHHDLPPRARTLPIPRRFAAQGVRRYGFHGLSYQYLMGELERLAGTEAARGRVILAHLGNGASLAAVCGGRCIDTTMAFTPTAGLVMSTRTGDLDPGLMAFLLRSEGMAPEQLQRMVNHESGLLGISETSSDMRDLLEREGSDARAAEAVEIFCYQTRKWIGAYAAALEGLDTLVFAGGIGEHAPVVRERICAGLEFLGVRLNHDANTQNAGVISDPSSGVQARVIPTDEECVIARAVSCWLEGNQ
jgi:acetate kinase